MAIKQTRRTSIAKAREAPAPEVAAGGVGRVGRLDVLASSLLVALALSLYLFRLGTPPVYIYDEAYHAYTGTQYAQGRLDEWMGNASPQREGVGFTWNHPPLGVELISLGILLFGDDPFGWRFMSAVFGAIGVAVAYLLALMLTQSRAMALLTSCLLLVDGLYFVQSRTSMLDIFGTVFILGALATFYKYLTSPPDRVRLPLLLTGLLMGLAIATKWNAAYPSILIGIAVLWRWYRLHSTSRRWQLKPQMLAGLRQHIRWVPVGLVLLPVCVYLLAHVPFFLSGHTFSQFLELQAAMLSYHRGLTETHPYQSAWWSWPLALRPVRYYAQHLPDSIANTYALGNPLLFWAFLPAVAWVIWRWWRERKPALAVLLIGFFGQWLPWMLVPRSAFLYHFLPVVPFGCLAVAVLLVELWKRGRAGRVIVLGYVAAVVLVFTYFYPIYSALPLPYSGFEARMWLRSWR